MSNWTVPVIDVADWASGDRARRESIAHEVDSACSGIGFFQIVGHGVPDESIVALLDEIDSFFHLPATTKAETAPPSNAINRGFLAIGSESLSYTVGVDAPADLREAFVIGRDDMPDDEIHRADPYTVFAPYLWPAAPIGLRPAMVTYFEEVARLSRTVVDIYAIALGLPLEFFRQHLTHSTETLRVNYYERLDPQATVTDGQQRLGAHTDYGITTVLHADRVPGLQLLDGDGRWHDVIAEPGAFIVNLGDLLAQWTNDRWRSTVHRVVSNDDRLAPGTRRRSLAFFLDGNYDSVIECLPTCCDEDHPAMYPSTTAGANLAEKLRGARSLTKVDTMDTVGDRIDAVRRL